MKSLKNFLENISDKPKEKNKVKEYIYNPKKYSATGPVSSFAGKT